MGIQLDDRPKPSGDRAPNYDPGRGLDAAKPEIQPQKPMLGITALIVGLCVAAGVAWGMRAYLMP